MPRAKVPEAPQPPVGASYVIDAIDEENSTVHVTFTLSDGTVERPQSIHSYYLSDPVELKRQLDDYAAAFEWGILIERNAAAQRAAHPDVKKLVGKIVTVETPQ